MRRRMLGAARWSVVALLVIALAMPAAGVPRGRSAPGSRLLNHVSQSVALQHWLAHPAQAPAPLRARFGAAKEAAAEAIATNAASAEDVFNNDVLGLPQNEESVSVCNADPNLLIGGTNDYRGLLDPEGNFTGWHLSVDNGASLAKEGLLPPVEIGGAVARPSGGDPVDAISRQDCDIYASSLNYDPFEPFGNTNGIGIYKTDRDTLLSPACGNDGPSDPDCWPTRRYAAFSSNPTHFFDKEWFDVGDTGDGEHVWVTYSDFDLAPVPPNPAGFTAEIFAVRCDADLTECTDPIPISENDVDVQFSDVTIGPDGRTYVTWSQIFGELEGTAQTFVHKIRVAEPGSTTFGKERTIFRETLAIPFGGFLHANDFRVATYPHNEVRMVGRKPRIFVVWDACAARPLDFVCEEPVIKISRSDTGGAAWTRPTVISAGGDNYFANISNDAAGASLAVVWFTNRFDEAFHNRQDVELVTLNPGTLAVTNRQRVTATSNETEADPLLGGFFIGDYIEVAAHAGVGYTHYNANARFVRLLGEGVPIPQQDNYLTKTPL